MRVGDSAPSFRARAHTEAQAARAPTNAATFIDSPPSAAEPSTITKTAPTLAPEETPRMYGSASGLRTVTCISAPASASPAPASAARSVLGRRNCQTA